jgi:hypothetical protein
MGAKEAISKKTDRFVGLCQQARHRAGTVLVRTAAVNSTHGAGCFRPGWPVIWRWGAGCLRPYCWSAVSRRSCKPHRGPYGSDPSHSIPCISSASHPSDPEPDKEPIWTTEGLNSRHRGPENTWMAGGREAGESLNKTTNLLLALPAWSIYRQRSHPTPAARFARIDGSKILRPEPSICAPQEGNPSPQRRQ